MDTVALGPQNFGLVSHADKAVGADVEISAPKTDASIYLERRQRAMPSFVPYSPFCSRLAARNSFHGSASQRVAATIEHVDRLLQRVGGSLSRQSEQFSDADAVHTDHPSSINAASASHTTFQSSDSSSSSRRKALRAALSLSFAPYQSSVSSPAAPNFACKTTAPQDRDLLSYSSVRRSMNIE